MVLKNIFGTLTMLLLLLRDKRIYVLIDLLLAWFPGKTIGFTGGMFQKLAS